MDVEVLSFRNTTPGFRVANEQQNSDTNMINFTSKILKASLIILSSTWNRITMAELLIISNGFNKSTQILEVISCFKNMLIEIR